MIDKRAVCSVNSRNREASGRQHHVLKAVGPTTNPAQPAQKEGNAMTQANIFARKQEVSGGFALLLALLGSLLWTSNLAAGALTITTTSPLPNGTVDTFYSTTFAASGGTSPYAWTITSGSVPVVTISSTGVLSGVPAAASAYSITVQVMDSTTPTPLTATATFNITTAVSANINYYVSTSGSNTTGNGSSSAPWATIAYAVSKVAGPGVTINVAAGTYNETADIAINTGGSAAGGYFILRNSNYPTAAIINGSGVPIGSTGYAYDLPPDFRTSPSMISDEGKGKGYVEEQAQRGADDRGAEAVRGGAKG
jgi:hypothetical protein